MVIWRVLAAALLTLLGACTTKPSSDDVHVVLQQNLPESFREVARVEQLQTEMTTESNSVVIKFKAQLKLSEPLYAAADFSRAAESAGVDPVKFASAERTLQSVPDNLRQQFEGDIQRLLRRPTFIDQKAAAGAVSEWYGSFRSKKVVDKWVVSDFHTDVLPTIAGVRRSALPSDALSLQKAPDWFTGVRREYEEIFRRIADAQKVQQAEERAAVAQAAAQQERDARERAVALATQQARQMPIRYGFRQAALGGSMVLRIQVIAPMTVTLNVVRGHQRFTRNLQLLPGRTAEFGHLEGWAFRGGDQVTLTNGSFDPVEFKAP